MHACEIHSLNRWPFPPTALRNVSGYAATSWNRGHRHAATTILLIAFLARCWIAVDWHEKAKAATSNVPANYAASHATEQNNAPEKLPFRLGDSHSYWTLAEQIASGRDYQYGSENARIFRAPLYPIFLVPFTQVSGTAGVFWARIAGCLLGTLAVGVLMRLGYLFAHSLEMISLQTPTRPTAPQSPDTQQIAIAKACLTPGSLTPESGSSAAPITALATGVLAALHPGAIGASVTVLAEALFYPLMAGHILILSHAILTNALHSRFSQVRRSDTIYLAASGVLAGLAILARPSWLLFIPFVTVFALLLLRHRTWTLKAAIISTIAIALVMTPWWIRNAMVTGHFVPTTLQVGLSLYDGLHEGATGASDEDMAFSMQLQEEQRQLDAELSLQSNREPDSTLEFRVDQLAKQRAIHWAAENPLPVVTLAGRKFVRTWSLWPDGGELGSPAVRLLVTAGTFGILLLAFYGSWRVLQSGAAGAAHRRILWLCWMPCIYFTFLHMVFVGSIRYREPGVFVLCIVAGVGLNHIVQRLRKQSASETATVKE